MTKSTQTINDLAYELEDDLGALSLKVGTLNDINTTMEQLRMDMDEVKNEDMAFYFKVAHTKIRLLNDLLRYTMKSLNEEFKETHNTKDALLDKIKDKVI